MLSEGHTPACKDHLTMWVVDTNVRVLAAGGDAIIVQADPRPDARSSNSDAVHDNVVTFLGATGDFGFRDYAHATFTGTSSDHNTFCVPDTGNSYWSWSLPSNGWDANPTKWSTYQSESGMDATSTLMTGDCSKSGNTSGCAAMP